MINYDHYDASLSAAREVEYSYASMLFYVFYKINMMTFREMVSWELKNFLTTRANPARVCERLSLFCIVSDIDIRKKGGIVSTPSPNFIKVRVIDGGVIRCQHMVGDCLASFPL